MSKDLYSPVNSEFSNIDHVLIYMQKSRIYVKCTDSIFNNK